MPKPKKTRGPGRGGSHNGNAKLTPTQVKRARMRLAGGETASKIAKDFGVEVSTVTRLGKRQTWDRTT